MRRRLYLVLPDVESARQLHNDLLLARVEEKHMHVMARRGSVLQDLPEAGLLQKSDIVHGAQLGFILGGFSGAVLGSLAVMLGFIVPGVEVLSVGVITFGGALFGLFTSTMIAVNVTNTRLKTFMPDIEQGRLLFMVDVPVTRLDDIVQLVRQHHPRAILHDIEPTIPAFP
jgi:hypothetical protein